MNPLRNDNETTTSSRSSCPTCGTGFTPIRRQTYCTPACRQAAWRARHTGPRPAEIPIVIARPRRETTVYACTECEQRYHGEQWCPDCQRPCRRVDTGGLCPHCDEPVTILELLDHHISQDPQD